MPSGYTHQVNDGTMTNLKDFVLYCARAFGACIMQRDDSPSELPKLQPIDPYHLNEFLNAQKKLAELKMITIDEANKLADAEYRKVVAEKKKYSKKNDESKVRYNAMLAKVKAWVPPTPDHNELKTFMIEQLQSSMYFDVMDDGFYGDPVKSDGAKWLADRIESAECGIKYHAKKYDEEIERTNSRNKWISDLYNSLK